MSDFQPKPFGKYFLIEKLATGGMAEIYKAKTFGVDGFEKLLAIKRILPHCSTDKEFITMLIDEAKLSVALSHTNITQVFDLGKVGDDYFISMEFVDGVNLREMIQRCREINEPLPEDIAVYIISEMCKGLDYAHAKKDMDGRPLGIVHRDISPQNILISFEGEVKVVDFGIAKAAMNISHTTAGVLKGKITYMSPEQALGKPVDYKTDIFSVGLMLYELLTGQRFFTGETQFEVLKKIRSTRINENNFPNSIPAGLKKILAKALAYQPKDRFENAGDMQIELTKYLYSTYIDFSPRKLSNLVKRVFAQEIQNRSSKPKESSSLDDMTRSMLLEAGAQQNIVHRDDADKTSIGAGLRGTRGSRFTPLSLQATSPIRMFFLRRPTLSKIMVGLLLLTAVGSYFVYQNFKPSLQGKHLGVLSIKSEPSGAKIYLNDKDIELVTPSSVRGVELNFSQKISLKKPKYREWTRLVTLVSPDPLNVEATLEFNPAGTLVVSTIPKGAKIYLDGKDLGLVTPTEVPDLDLNKTYVLRLEKEDYKPLEEKITISSTEATKFDKKLEEIKYGSLEVSSTPAGATIYLNNKNTNLVTPNRIQKLELGKPIALRLSKNKYHDSFRTLQLENEKTLSITERLMTEEEFKKKEDERKKQQEAEQKKAQEKEKEKKATEEAKKAAEEAKKTEPVKPPEPLSPPVSGGEFGILRVESSPSGASVFIDGISTGRRTPLVIRGVRRGKDHTVRLELEGYKGWSTSFVLEGESKSLSATLKKQ